MTLLQSILLGLLQGVTEFLPVSSSGHLTVAQKLFNLQKVPLLFDIILHIATLFAVIIFFRKQIFDLILVFCRFVTKKTTEEDKPKLTMIVALIVATAITGGLGIFASKIIPDLPIKFVCVGFIVTAILLIISNLKKQKTEPQKGEVSIKQGIFCGIAQGFGVLPGISRSGITISASIASGINRETAGEFSFLLSIPAILGAFILELKDFESMADSISIVTLIAGCVAAFISGILALTFLMKLVKSGKLYWFAVYLIPLGILGLIFF